MKKIILMLLLGAMALTGAAQEKVYQVEEIMIINCADGRLLFHQKNDDKTPFNGTHRIIDGYGLEYILADFKDGMYHGKYQQFKKNKLFEESYYQAGVLHGTQKRYYHFLEPVQLQSERSFVDGKLDGTSTTYGQNGKIEAEQQFSMGVENGFERKYDSDGKLAVDHNYKNGKPDGKWTGNMWSNVGSYSYVSYYKNGLKEGQWSETWEDGTPREKMSYKEGKLDGVCIIYRKDGKPEKSITYKSGEKNGEEITYFTDGTPDKSANYLNGKLDGVSKEFYFNTHKPKSEFTYKNGKREGAYKRYYDNGTVREEGNCEADNEVYRKEYYPNGKLKSVAERKGGSWNTIERYDSQGNKDSEP